MRAEVPVLQFHQYGAEDPDDRLLMFAATASDLWGWAGIPRKGWRVRMLYQRWITESRKEEVIAFWDKVSKPRSDHPRKYLVGPNAITVAIFDEPELVNRKLTLAYERPFKDSDSEPEKLGACATRVVQRMGSRLTEGELAILNDSERWTEDELGHNYVLESLCQIKSASENAEQFIEMNELTQDDITQLIESLEALCRPALVVDGQHRLYGAANSNNPKIWLPVVAIPNSPWMEQIYQFVVINEKARKVESSLLTDIFGSSLTPSEQEEIRSQLNIAGAAVDPRIAAVIAGRDPRSPFYNMVKIQLEGDPPGTSRGYIPEATIRHLIDGGRGSRGWRSDDEFYDTFVRPTLPDRAAWEAWSDGVWRDYWFTFWSTVRDWYNEAAKDKDKDGALWSNRQSNLTKAVTLRLFQRLFMEEAIKRVRGIEASRETLVEVLGEEIAEEKLAEKIETVAIPNNLDDFSVMVKSWFLKDGIPVRVFQYPWVSSLDDAAGQELLYQELQDAFRLTKEPGKTYRAQNSKIFTTPDK
jgi:hypothetical protein